MNIEAIENYALEQKISKKGSLQRVGIIGGGRMGREIILLVAQHGIDVTFLDLSDKIIDNSFRQMELALDEVILKWGMTSGEKKIILSRIEGTTEYSKLANCDLIIESINSRKPGSNKLVRQEVFRKVEEVVRPDVVITSNTSTLMISDLATVLVHPERAVGLHFITPASEVSIVEAVRGVYTDDASYEYVKRFASMIEKKVVTINESPGNISTRLIVTLINEACETLMEGVASVSCIDTTMKKGYGLQFGPFEMADRIGLDKVVKWMDNLYDEFGTPRFKTSPILKRLARAKQTGIDAGMGFYEYENGKAARTHVSHFDFK